MKRVAWITDSTTASFTTEGDNFVIPIEVIIDGVSYKDCEEGVRERVYNALNEGKTVTTSQPNIGKWQNYFRNAKEEYEEGLAVAISGKVSGTYQNMKLAAEMAGFPLTVLDSETTSYPMDELIRKAKSLYNDGMTLQDIHKTLVDEKRRPFHVFPKSLKGLYASGRVKGVQFLLGSLLSVNLILEVKGGELYLKRKVRKIQNVENTLKMNLKKNYQKYFTCSMLTIKMELKNGLQILDKHSLKWISNYIHYQFHLRYMQVKVQQQLVIKKKTRE